MYCFIAFYWLVSSTEKVILLVRRIIVFRLFLYVTYHDLYAIVHFGHICLNYVHGADVYSSRNIEHLLHDPFLAGNCSEWRAWSLCQRHLYPLVFFGTALLANHGDGNQHQLGTHLHDSVYFFYDKFFVSIGT